MSIKTKTNSNSFMDSIKSGINKVDRWLDSKTPVVVDSSLDLAESVFVDTYADKQPVEGVFTEYKRERAIAQFHKAISDAKKALAVVDALSDMDKKR